MRLIVLLLFIALGAGYFVTYHVLTDSVAKWYAYFVTNDLKAFLISLALMAVTYRKKEFIFSASAGVICTYDLVTQIADLNQKGNWAAIIYQILLVLLTINILIWYWRQQST